MDFGKSCAGLLCAFVALSSLAACNQSRQADTPSGLPVPRYVTLANGEAAASQVRGELTRRGYRLEHVAKIEPSLEDVFIRLVEGAER